MRAYLWFGLGTLMWACGGSAFTADGGTSGSGNGGSGNGGSENVGGEAAGTTNGAAGSDAVGTGGSSDSGGSSASGGSVSVGGDLGFAGDLVTGGTLPVAGEPGVGGTNVGGTGPTPIDEVCPAERPSVGGACLTGLSCSYGSDLRPECRDRAKCNDGAWQVEKPGCESLPECKGVEEGKECTANDVPACAALGSVYCVCTGCTGAGPCSTNTVWRCAKPPTNNSCPRVLPNDGKSCTKELECNYGACVTDNPMNASCDGATWLWQEAACPL